MASDDEVSVSDLCKKCDKVVESGDKALQCEGFCEKWMHIRCGNVSSKDYSKIKDLKIAMWMCGDCKVFLKLLSNNKLHEIIELQKKNLDRVDKVDKTIKIYGKEIEKLQVNIERHSNTVTASYAAATKRKVNDLLPNRQTNQPTSQGIVIKPKKEQKSDDTRAKIKENVQPSKIRTPVIQMKNINKGGVIIKSDSKANNEKIATVLKNKIGADYEVYETKERNPKLFVTNLERNYSSAELLLELKQLNHFITDEDMIKVVHSRKSRNGRWTIFMEVTGLTYNKMVDRYINIDWNTHYVREDFGIKRCFNCNRYNHSTDSCTNPTVCGKCAGEHQTSQCNSEIHVCVNCQKSKINRVCRYHTADSGVCPEFLRQVEFVQNKTNYTVQKI